MSDEPTAMTPDPSEKAVFAEALLRDTPEARAAYLEGACGTDIALRRRVEALLRAAENAGGFLEEPPTGLVNDSSAASASEIWNDTAPSTALSAKAAQWRLKLASFDMAQARMKADALQPKPTE